MLRLCQQLRKTSAWMRSVLDYDSVGENEYEYGISEPRMVASEFIGIGNVLQPMT